MKIRSIIGAMLGRKRTERVNLILRASGLILTLVILATALPLAAVVAADATGEIPPLAWDETYGGTGRDMGQWIEETADGNYIMAGSLGSGSTGASDAWLVKMDPSGGEIWSQQYDISGSQDQAFCVQQTADSGYITAGVTGPGVWDAVLIKTDALGNKTKHKVLPETLSKGGSDVLACVHQTPDGGFVAAGGSNSWDGYWDCYLVKTDGDLNVQWERRYHGSWNEEFLSMDLASDGGYIMVGWTESSELTTGSGADMLVIKTDANGYVGSSYPGTFEKTYSVGGNDFATDVRQLDDGSYIVTGDVNLSGTGKDFYLMKLNAAGGKVWGYAYGTVGYDHPVSLDLTADGGYVMAGCTDSALIPNVVGSTSAGNLDFYLVKTDSNGNQTGTAVIGGPGYDFAECVRQTSSGSYIAAGRVSSSGSLGAGDFDAYVVKYGSSEGYAIIVAGQMEKTRHRNMVNHGANNAYRALRNLGYDDDHIVYLNSNDDQNVDRDDASEVDGPATLTEFETAINNVSGAIGDAPLVMYLFGHGSLDGAYGGFWFDENSPDDEAAIYDWELRRLLQPFANKMLVVVNSCHSGSFITGGVSADDSVSLENRIVIATSPSSLPITLSYAVGWSDLFWGRLEKGKSVKDAFVFASLSWPQPLLDDNGDTEGHSAWFLSDDGALAQNTKIGTPGSDDLQLTPSYLFWKKSPGEMRVYDSYGNMTGLLNGQIYNDIPGSDYDPEDDATVILDSEGDYVCRVVGTDEGTYGLDIAFGPGDSAGVFSATDIPLTLGAIHQYEIDWGMLSQGGEGATLGVDADGDGTFEQTITSSRTLAAPVAEAGGPYFSEEGSTVRFDASGSYDSDGSIISFEWDFDSDGIWDFSSAQPTASHLWPDDYVGNITLRVTDDDGFTGVDTAAVRVGLRRILSCDSAGNPMERFAVGQSVYVKGSGLKPNTNYLVWIQDEAVTEGDALVSGEDPSGEQELVTTDGNGDFGPVKIWDIPSDAEVSYHPYDIVLDKQDDGENTGKCNSASDGIDSVAAVGFCAPVPELATLLLFGTGLFMLGGLVLWTKRRPAA